MDNQNIVQSNKKLVIDGGKYLSLTGVESVDGFSDEFIKLSLYDSKVNINGNGIKITSFNKSTGDFTAEGNFTNIRYGEKKGRFFKRLFS